jgi:hypothetical protein
MTREGDAVAKQATTHEATAIGLAESEAARLNLAWRPTVTARLLSQKGGHAGSSGRMRSGVGLAWWW